MYNIIKYIAYILLLPLILFIYLIVTEWRVKLIDRECFVVESCELSDTITIVTWNIGYGGLSEEMDFFYDGGKNTRTTYEQTQNNLAAIVAQLKEFAWADFILLQEVDFESHRSYNIDECAMIVDSLSGELPYVAHALNYNSKFVPIPIREPMGGVKSGVVTLSRYQLGESVRYQLSSEVALPNRLFDLKRCVLSVGVPIQGGDTLWVNNIHNTAFDSGDMRSCEVEFIGKIVEDQGFSITAGDWNSTPPDYTPSREAVENSYFSPHALLYEDLPSGVNVAADHTSESVRYLNLPYKKGFSTTTLVDFAIFSDDFELIECKTIDLGFKNSDHNPIIITLLRR